MADEMPWVAGNIGFELNDRTTSQKSGDTWRNDFYAFVEADVSIYPSKRWTIRAVATLEPLTDPRPRDNRAFENEDVRWKDVYAQYEGGPLGFRAGRITANFGTAWYAAPGLDATTLAEDYAIWDRAGASIWYRLESDSFGTTTIGASLFSMDTSELSQSWRNTRHQKTRERGGVSNTGSPSSFALSVDGVDIQGLQGFSWSLAVLQQSVDFYVDSTGQRVNRTAYERGVTAGFQKTLKVTNRLESTTTGEIAYLKNRGGVPGASGQYLTVGETFSYGQAFVQAAVTARRLDGPAAADSNDSLVTLTAGYNLSERLLLSAGWRRAAEVFDSREDNLRVRLRYAVPF